MLHTYSMLNCIHTNHVFMRINLQRFMCECNSSYLRRWCSPGPAPWRPPSSCSTQTQHADSRPTWTVCQKKCRHKQTFFLLNDAHLGSISPTCTALNVFELTDTWISDSVLLPMLSGRVFSSSHCLPTCPSSALSHTRHTALILALCLEVLSQGLGEDLILSLNFLPAKPYHFQLWVILLHNVEETILNLVLAYPPCTVRVQSLFECMHACMLLA